MQKDLSKLTIKDFIDAVKIVKDVSTKPVAISLWGWESVEPDAGENRTDAEVKGMQYIISQGFSPYIGLNVIDTVKRVVPEDLSEARWDDTTMISRYERAVEILASEMPKDTQYFVIANEIDVYFDKHPDEFPAFLIFYKNAAQIVHRHFPSAIVGSTVTFEGLMSTGYRQTVIQNTISVSDAAFFTYYPQINQVFTNPENTPPHLDTMILAAGGKNVILQEVGYPSEGKGTSLKRQADFFKTIIPAIHIRPQIKFAGIYALHDFDDGYCDTFLQYYNMLEFAQKNDAGRNFKKMMCSLGLLYSNGKPKPAWSEVTSAFKEIKSQNQ